MQEGKPSLTAFAVAGRRAAHQLIDHPPLVLDDPIAVPILGPYAAFAITSNPEKHRHPFSFAMRAFMVARSRYAEDHLRLAVADGVRQYVVLGAGLDTFAYRNPYPLEHLKVFEIDHPTTQQWKRELLSAANIALPENLSFVPVDFERQTLISALTESGFDFQQPAYFSWLGVTPYLTLEAFRSTLKAVAALPNNTGITFEYVLPRASLSERARTSFDLIAARVEKIGEPFQLFFTPEQMRDELEIHGFSKIEELTSADINTRYFSERNDGLRLYGEGGRLITAWL
ncbi:MAG TPA: class I SAM-dependent methyltransferase [Pseudacidobacterium sp.]|jgi:methyltransferase (TIGR00027 family)|nr:class I SAM-dependent methyltransferase [Pseudacidobacterium sp.]